MQGAKKGRVHVADVLVVGAVLATIGVFMVLDAAEEILLTRRDVLDVRGRVID